MGGLARLLRMSDRIRHATQRLHAVIREHGDASAMIGAAALILVAILAGAAVMRTISTRPEQAVAAWPSQIAATPVPSVTVLAPSPTQAAATRSATPSPAPTVAPTVDASGSDAETEVGTDGTPIDVEDPDLVVPTPTPEPEPSIALLLDGSGGRQGVSIRSGDSVDAVLGLTTRYLDTSECTVTQAYEPDDPAGVEAWTIRLQPRSAQTVTLIDGTHTFAATCPSSAGRLHETLRVTAMDGKPEACMDFEFSRDPITPASFDDLASAVVGTWIGCVTTPWTPMYNVVVRFNADGTYSAVSHEILDGTEMIALYYGMDEDSSKKRYALTDFQASGLGIGEIDVVFDVATTVRDELRNIRLMGDKLEFEMFHFGEYGPLTFQLYRADPPPPSS